MTCTYDNTALKGRENKGRIRNSKKKVEKKNNLEREQKKEEQKCLLLERQLYKGWQYTISTCHVSEMWRHILALTIEEHALFKKIFFFKNISLTSGNLNIVLHLKTLVTIYTWSQKASVQFQVVPRPGSVVVEHSPGMRKVGG